MDCDKGWDRTEKAYDLLTGGTASYSALTAVDALEAAYARGETDEFVKPTLVGTLPITVNDQDVVLFFNFRADRAVELTRAFEDPDFPGWNREMIKNLYFVGLTNYEKGFPKNQAFPPEKINNPLGKVISDNGLKQLRISESEKFPHVTYFVNGGNHIQYPGEDRIEVPSPKEVATYDKKPEMSSYAVTEIVLKKIVQGNYDVIMINFANPDMVGHTGILPATIKGMEVVDECVGKIYEILVPHGGAIVLTADHGNAEELIDILSGNVDTKHSTNPVPLIIIKDGLQPRELSFGILADVSPTVLSMLGIPKPIEMTGRNLLI